MRSIRLLLTLLAASSVSVAQQNPATSAPATQAQSQAAVDPRLHQDVVEFVELTGARKRIQDSFETSIPDGHKKLQEMYPHWDPRFGEEWKKRMMARSNVDDYLNVIIATYEKYFNDEDIQELIQMQRDANASKTSNVSPRMKEKLSATAVNVQSEILAGCSLVGSKLGGQIGQEIGQEHPDWVKDSTPGEKAPVKD